jgi:hypothetical protein
VDLPVTAAGTFQFTAALAVGTNYDITVATQPVSPSQLCTVTAGQGQIAAANVTNVVVDCRTLFTLLSTMPVDGATEISRSVHPTLTFSAPLDPATLSTGLATLTSIGGAETFVLNASGAVLSLVPSRSLLPLTEYTLDVTNTLLSDGGATLADPIHLTFRTREGEWGAQQELTDIDVNTGGLNVFYPRIVADLTGGVTTAWLNERGSLRKKELWARHRPAGGTWETATRVDVSDTEDIGDMALGGDDAGGVLAVWAQTSGGLVSDFSRVYARRFTPGGGWEAVQLVADLAGNQGQLQIAMHGDGSAMVVWYQSATGANAIHASRFVPATGWAASQKIDTATSAVQNPKIAVSDGGVATAIWEQYVTGAGNDLFAARFSPAAGWATPVLVTVTNNGISRGPSLASTAGGDAIATWYQSDAGMHYTASSYFHPGSGWEPVSRVETGAGDSDISRVAIDPQGVALAVWRQAISGVIHIHASRRDPLSGAWSTPERISNIVGNTAGAFYPVVAFDRRGNAMAAWFELETALSPPLYQVKGNRYTPDHGWGGAENIGVPDQIIDAATPRLAIDGAGTAWAAWSQRRGTDNVRRVFVNSFE